MVLQDWSLLCLQCKIMTLQKAVCMLTISSINVKGFIHGVHRYANAQSFSGLGTKLVALMVISVLIFALYLPFLKLFFFLIILHQIISICLGRYTDLSGFTQRLEGDLHRAGRSSGRDRQAFFILPFYIPHIFFFCFFWMASFPFPFFQSQLVKLDFFTFPITLVLLCNRQHSLLSL